MNYYGVTKDEKMSEDAMDKALRPALMLVEKNNIPVRGPKEFINGEYKYTFQVNWEEFWGINSEINYPELESMKNVYKRVSEFLDELLNKFRDKRILLVTHGGISRAIYWYFNGFDKSLFKCENCKIYEYNID